VLIVHADVSCYFVLGFLVVALLTKVHLLLAGIPLALNTVHGSFTVRRSEYEGFLRKSVSSLLSKQNSKIYSKLISIGKTADRQMNQKRQKT